MIQQICLWSVGFTHHLKPLHLIAYFLFGLYSNSRSEVSLSFSFLKSFSHSRFSCLSQVMLAASYWSLLAPAIDMAEDSGKYGSFAFLPVAVGFTLGAAFVYFADLAMPLLVRTWYLDSHTYSIVCTEDGRNSNSSRMWALNVAGAHAEELCRPSS